MSDWNMMCPIVSVIYISILRHCGTCEIFTLDSIRLAAIQGWVDEAFKYQIIEEGLSVKDK